MDKQNIMCKLQNQNYLENDRGYTELKVCQILIDFQRLVYPGNFQRLVYPGTKKVSGNV